MTENVTGYLAGLARGAATGSSLPAFGAEVFSPVLDIEDLKMPAPTRPVEAWKVLDQKASKKKVGSLDYGPCSGTCTRAFGDPIQDSMEDDANAADAVRRNWRGNLPDSGSEVRYFIGYVSKFEFDSITNDNRIKFSWEIVVDGDVTIVR